MFEMIGITKSFDRREVLKDITVTLREGSILGVVGTNGAGKSTLLRIASGAYRPDAGRVLLDGEELREDSPVRREIFYISDDPYTFPNGTIWEMRDFYRALYPAFDDILLSRLTELLGLGLRQKTSSFSKGMLRQAMICLAFASHARMILFDETFDGLDPVMRQAVKGLIAQRVEAGELLPVIASHNLRELEDIADHVAVLHRGMMVSELFLNREQELVKAQCAFEEPPERDWFRELELLQWNPNGRFVSFTARCSRAEAEAALAARNPLFSEFIPLSLEEIFIAQMEGVGYEAKNILL
ncbi:MAG: ABC transporter ATP-binding protein [Christensenellales bacterium]|jgi:ABC-2 type transport system ATP-binding protein